MKTISGMEVIGLWLHCRSVDHLRYHIPGLGPEDIFSFEIKRQIQVDSFCKSSQPWSIRLDTQFNE